MGGELAGALALSTQQIIKSTSFSIEGFNFLESLIEVDSFMKNLWPFMPIHVASQTYPSAVRPKFLDSYVP